MMHESNTCNNHSGGDVIGVAIGIWVLTVECYNASMVKLCFMYQYHALIFVFVKKERLTPYHYYDNGHSATRHIDKN